MNSNRIIIQPLNVYIPMSRSIPGQLRASFVQCCRLKVEHLFLTSHHQNEWNNEAVETQNTSHSNGDQHFNKGRGLYDSGRVDSDGASSRSVGAAEIWIIFTKQGNSYCKRRGSMTCRGSRRRMQIGLKMSIRRGRIYQFPKLGSLQRVLLRGPLSLFLKI